MVIYSDTGITKIRSQLLTKVLECSRNPSSKTILFETEDAAFKMYKAPDKEDPEKIEMLERIFLIEASEYIPGIHCNKITW